MLKKYMILTIIRTVSPTPRINPPHRIRRILIQIQPTGQPYRVLLGKASRIRRVVPEGIIVQSGFSVEILTLKT